MNESYVFASILQQILLHEVNNQFLSIVYDTIYIYIYILFNLLDWGLIFFKITNLT
jgi:hypothetical protein